jgi:hypothetical protein
VLHLVTRIRVHGHVDQQGLERLRAELRLTKQGRLSDDWDENFGNRRIERPSGESFKVSLYRHSADGTWTVNVSTTQPLPDDREVAALRDRLVANVAAAGFQATSQPSPRYGP